jgi:hypothetical protein
MSNTSKFTALAAASAIAVASIFPVSAFAQDAGSIPSSSGSAAASQIIEPGVGIDQGTTGSIAPASRVNVKQIGALENDEARQFENITADQLAAAQQKLQDNPGLVSELQAKGVQLNNVVDVQTFGNGGVLVYVR